MNTRSIHLLCELSGCNQAVIASVDAVKSALERGAVAANATILSSCFHQFVPTGVSGVVCLAESHISIHTWPESGYAAVDIFTCGETTTPHDAVGVISATMEAKQTRVREITRGLDSGLGHFISQETSAPCLNN